MASEESPTNKVSDVKLGPTEVEAGLAHVAQQGRRGAVSYKRQTELAVGLAGKSDVTPLPTHRVLNDRSPRGETPAKGGEK
jgi:hypothetical protein